MYVCVCAHVYAVHTFKKNFSGDNMHYFNKELYDLSLQSIAANEEMKFNILNFFK